MLEFFRAAVQVIAPIFVVATMLNVGLTQKLAEIIEHLKNIGFIFKMLLANFVLAPLLMVLMLRLAPFDPDLKAGLAFVLMAFGIGYLMGGGKDHLEDVGGLATAQRNTAAGVIIATQNFSEQPNVLVMLTLANTLGIVLLLGVAKLLSRDNEASTQPV